MITSPLQLRTAAHQLPPPLQLPQPLQQQSALSMLPLQPPIQLPGESLEQQQQQEDPEVSTPQQLLAPLLALFSPLWQQPQ
jgi:hypothetical protein